MNEEDSVSVKVYLFEGSKTVEVRRFEIDQSAIANYDYVRERLQLIMPRIRGKQYKLLWQDADGDEVIISSDEELMIALSELKTNIIKFIVRLSTSDTEDLPQVNVHIPSLHDLYALFNSFFESCPLFTELQSDENCSSCKQPIVGTKYKCLECVQYNHCGECEYKKLHPDHVMLRFNGSTSFGDWMPKCAQMLKSNLIQGTKCAGTSANNFFREKMSHSYSEKEKCGHHKRRFRKHCHFSGEKKPTQEESTPECSYSGQAFNNISNVISAFLGMYKDVLENHVVSENNAGTNGQTANKNDSQPMTVDMETCSPIPVGSEDENMQDNAAAGATAPSTSTQADADPKINEALAILTEMGFKDENQWLTRLLHHFNGDITKLIDHLTLGK